MRDDADAHPPRAPHRTSGSDPLWRQAADVIRADIERRGLAEGDKLPSERDLCARLEISRVTLRKALGHLVDQGILTATHGRGWFVATAPAPSTTASSRDWPNDLESFTATARRKRMTPASLVLRQVRRPATLDEAERLDVPAGTELFGLDRVRLLNDVRIAVDRTLVVAELVAGLDEDEVDFTSASLFEELRRRGVELDRSEATIEARTADGELAGHLEIEPGSPVLVLDQAIHDRDRRPVLLSVVEYSGERYRLRTTLQTV
ncbi:GntR family transcriptional regulator [Streptomyces sp. NPDC058274]|uniref:GntR family transcriptional regulator n=1 Tax=Streptomyces sp. NPDC058274 TaxID=3346416 RepID=UPI0036EE4602